MFTKIPISPVFNKMEALSEKHHAGFTNPDDYFSETVCFRKKSVDDKKPAELLFKHSRKL